MSDSVRYTALSALICWQRTMIQYGMLVAAAAMQNRSTAQSLNGDALVESVPPADLAVCDVATLNGQSVGTFG